MEAPPSAASLASAEARHAEATANARADELEEKLAKLAYEFTRLVNFVNNNCVLKDDVE